LRHPFTAKDEPINNDMVPRKMVAARDIPMSTGERRRPSSERQLQNIASWVRRIRAALSEIRADIPGTPDDSEHNFRSG
jgi:hypothetical protein